MAEARPPSSSSRPGSSARQKHAREASAGRTAAEKEMHLNAARHLPGSRPARGFALLVEWMRRHRTCLLLEHFCLGPEEALNLLKEASLEAYPEGKVLYQQDDAGPSAAYIVLDGTVSLHSRDVHSQAEADDYLGMAHHDLSVSSRIPSSGSSSSSTLTSTSHHAKKRPATDELSVNVMNSLMGGASPDVSRRHLPPIVLAGDSDCAAKEERRRKRKVDGHQITVTDLEQQDGDSVFEDAANEEVGHGFQLDLMVEGNSFGEMALLRPDRPRSFTAVAQSDVELLVIDLDHMKSFTSQVSRKALDEKLQILESNAVFQQWKWMGQVRLASYMKEVSVPVETTVFRQHEPVATVYFIKSGQVRLFGEEKAEIASKPFLSRQGSLDPGSGRSPYGSTDGLDTIGAAAAGGQKSRTQFQYNKIKNIATVGTSDILGGYEVAHDLPGYRFSAQTAENTVLYEIEKQKFHAIVKKYSRRSLKELATEGVARYGLAPPAPQGKARLRKRSFSASDIPQAVRGSGGPTTHAHSKHFLPAISAKTSPRSPMTGLSRSMSNSPVMSRSSSRTASPVSTSGTSTPTRREFLPPLNPSSRPGSSLTANRDNFSTALAHHLSNLVDGSSGSTPPTVVRSPATARRAAAGRWDQSQRSASPMTMRRAATLDSPVHLHGGNMS
eukprot:scpid34553/ scgid3830/ 